MLSVIVPPICFVITTPSAQSEASCFQNESLNLCDGVCMITDPLKSDRLNQCDRIVHFVEKRTNESGSGAGHSC